MDALVRALECVARVVINQHLGANGPAPGGTGIGGRAHEQPAGHTHGSSCKQPSPASPSRAARLQISLFLRDAPSSAKWLPKCTSLKICRVGGAQQGYQIIWPSQGAKQCTSL